MNTFLFISVLLEAQMIHPHKDLYAVVKKYKEKKGNILHFQSTTYSFWLFK